MDQFDAEGQGMPETERERRDRALLRMVADCTPREFWLGIQSGGRRIYQETLDRNQGDPNLLQQSIGFKTVSDRHFYSDKLLYDLSLEFGFQCVPELIKINRWRYTQTSFGMFTSIQKYCRTRQELPKPADFRRKLAMSGGISLQDDLLRPRLVTSLGAKPLNGILIHGPLSRVPRSADFGQIGFMCFAIPYDDYSDWAAILDVDKLIEVCKNQVIDGLERENAREVAPGFTWKVRPDEAE